MSDFKAAYFPVSVTGQLSTIVGHTRVLIFKGVRMDE